MDELIRNAKENAENDAEERQEQDDGVQIQDPADLVKSKIKGAAQTTASEEPGEEPDTDQQEHDTPRESTSQDTAPENTEPETSQDNRPAEDAQDAETDAQEDAPASGSLWEDSETMDEAESQQQEETQAPEQPDPAATSAEPEPVTPQSQGQQEIGSDTASSEQRFKEIKTEMKEKLLQEEKKKQQADVSEPDDDPADPGDGVIVH